MVLQDVQTMKKPLQGLLPDLYLIKPLKMLLEKDRLESDCRRLQALEVTIRHAFLSSQDQDRGSNLTELVSSVKSYLKILSDTLLDTSLEKLMTGAVKEKDPLTEKLC